MPVYTLVIASKGPKLEKFKEGSCFPSGFPIGRQVSCGSFVVRTNGKTVMVDASAHTVKQFSQSVHLDRPIIDKTGIQGRYDFHLDFGPDERTTGLIPAGLPAGELSEQLPSIFAAFQEQLGLRLVPGKGPVEVIVIDSVQKPSVN